MKLAIAHDDPAFLAMSEEEQAFLLGLAGELQAMLDDAERAIAKKLRDQLLDMDEHLALWGLLPAKVKTAIKRANTPAGVECAECGLTGAHTRHCSIGGKFA